MEIYPLPPFTLRDRREQKARVNRLLTEAEREKHRQHMKELNEGLRKFVCTLEAAFKASAGSKLRFA